MNHHRLGVWHGMQPMTPMRMQDAGWLARTLGRGDLAPFTDADLEALALAKPTRVALYLLAVGLDWRRS
jgi:hypothetical protein